MCGILFSLCSSDAEHELYPATWETLQALNTKRGPSAQGGHSAILPVAAASSQALHRLEFYGAVLHLRGDSVCQQPHVSPLDNILLWNGEVFDGLIVGQHDNDGKVLMDALEAVAGADPLEHERQLLAVMSRIEGPFAFVYYHNVSKRLFFGRDCLGRRSLLWHRSNQTSEAPFLLTSVGYSRHQANCLSLDEVPANGFYSLSVDDPTCTLTHYPWRQQDAIIDTSSTPSMTLPFGRVNDTIPTGDQLSKPFPPDAKMDAAHPELVPEMSAEMKQAVHDMIATLGDSVRRRVQHIPRTGLPHEARVGILFSGGLDCLCLAALADRFLPKGEAIDLLNVGFENPRSQRARAAEAALALKKKNNNNKAKQQKNPQSKHPRSQKGDSAPPPPQEDDAPQATTTSSTSPSSSTTDDKDAPAQQQQQQQQAQQQHAKYNVPDRITGYESLAELRRIAPDRHWNFVEVNVPFAEAMEQREAILERIAPLDTVMDLSIAMAFWFAARGVGELKQEMMTTTKKKNMNKKRGEEQQPQQQFGEEGEEEQEEEEEVQVQVEWLPYTSQAKVLLSGLGADEQLGGYSRHKDQFEEAGWEGLIQELQLDLDRISTRNLGRDDRIISDHGKEVRYPFLSTTVVQFLSQLRVDLKVDLRYPRGVGEKLLLRHVARELGCDRASRHWKRAVQFGARTAKMTEGNRAEVGQQTVVR
ncbi:hypothetical protein DFQ27_002344 [Actinomortierella ambigua]|uniref:Asparagine synthetase domain-containing protein n=1 Tax=Actinomortierella ambigua TaxID=1343610 RepID=A0A9P6U6B6_9FUNG|nr:hypothetical protein DFQ27_002344 [Actinomortierella ambigua]